MKLNSKLIKILILTCCANSYAAQVDFRILKGTGNSSWNTEDQAVQVKIGDVLRIYNDDDVVHQLHTPSTPCPHGRPIQPGQSGDCAIKSAYDVAKSGPLYEHNVGPEARFWLKVATNLQVQNKIKLLPLKYRQKKWSMFEDTEPTRPEDILEFSQSCAITTKKVHCWQGPSAGVFHDFKNPRQIKSSENHNCLIDDNGVWCWGNNSYGQTDVPYGIKNPKLLAVNGYESCVVHDEGITCWGRYGKELSRRSYFSTRQIVMNDSFNICVLDDSGIHCWDESRDYYIPNDHIQNPTSVDLLYNGNFCASDDAGIYCNDYPGTLPSGLKGSTDFKSIENGFCVVKLNKTHCFDFDGNEILTSILKSPRQIAGNCALDIDGIKCWSYEHEELRSKFINEKINVDKDFIVGQGAGCGYNSKNLLKCWGGDASNSIDLNAPAGFSFRGQLFNTAIHRDQICAINTAKQVACWGAFSNEIILPDYINNPRSIMFGRDVNGLNYADGGCLLDQDGMKCWGRYKSEKFTAPISLANKITSFSMGKNHICAIAEGSVACWGEDNFDSQLNVPVDVVNALQVTSGSNFNCALLKNKTIKCWGANNTHQLEAPLKLNNPVQIVSGYDHSCVLDNDQVTCWGDNDYANQLIVPAGLKNIIHLQATSYSTCAIMQDSVKCWGYNPDIVGQAPPVPL